MKKRCALIALLLITCGVAVSVRAQEPARKPRPAPQVQVQPPPAETPPEPAAREDILQRAVNELSENIRLLNAELKRLRQEGERSTLTLELLLYEERLARMEGKVEAAEREKYQLEARSREIEYRLRNIQQEVTLRGGLRRSEAEEAIRGQLQRMQEENRAERAAAEQRLSDLQGQADRLRARIIVLRARLEPPASEEKKEQ